MAASEGQEIKAVPFRSLSATTRHLPAEPVKQRRAGLVALSCIPNTFTGEGRRLLYFCLFQLVGTSTRAISSQDISASGELSHQRRATPDTIARQVPNTQRNSLARQARIVTLPAVNCWPTAPRVQPGTTATFQDLTFQEGRAKRVCFCQHPRHS